MARSYSELIALSTASFVAFGVFSLPAGWLADRWSRRNMMAAFYVGCGLSLAGAALAPNLIALAAALFALGVFAAIYHPVGMAMLIDAANDARPHARLQRGVRQSRRRARGRRHRGAGLVARLARRLHGSRRSVRRDRNRLSRPGAGRPAPHRQARLGRRRSAARTRRPP